MKWTSSYSKMPKTARPIAICFESAPDVINYALGVIVHEGAPHFKWRYLDINQVLPVFEKKTNE